MRGVLRLLPLARRSIFGLPRRAIQELPWTENSDPPIRIEVEQMMVPSDNERSLRLDSAFEHTVVIRVMTFRDCAFGFDGVG